MGTVFMFGQAPLLLAVFLAVGAVIFVNGWTDAPIAIATCVSSGALGERRAVMMAAVCNWIGIAVSCMAKPAVAITVKELVDLSDISGTVALAVILCAMITTGIWAVVAWFFGIPTSESHALLAGLSGAAVAVCGWQGINEDAWRRIAIGLLISLVGGFAAGFFMDGALPHLIRRRDSSEAEKNSKRMLVVGAASMALMHGAQDGQKLIGIWLMAFSLHGDMMGMSLRTLTVVCAVLMGFGTLFGGGRIIKTLGEKLVKTGIREGIAADVGAAVCLLVVTAVGLPVSTTHTKTAALMGTGAAEGRGRLNLSVAAKLVAAWLLTFPVCFVVSCVGMKALVRVIGG